METDVIKRSAVYSPQLSQRGTPAMPNNDRPQEETDRRPDRARPSDHKSRDQTALRSAGRKIVVNPHRWF